MSKTLLILIVLLLVGCAALFKARGRIEQLFGPGRVQLEEHYADSAADAAFDHGRFDALLKLHVKPGGWVDYAGLKTSSEELDG